MLLLVVTLPFSLCCVIKVVQVGFYLDENLLGQAAENQVEFYLAKNQVEFYLAKIQVEFYLAKNQVEFYLDKNQVEFLSR